MKRIFLVAGAALTLAAPGLSLAQDDRHSGGGQFHPQGAPQARPAMPTQSAPQVRSAAPVQTYRGGGGPQGGFQRGGYPQGGQPTYRPQSGAQPGGQGGYRPDRQGPNFPGGQGGYRSPLNGSGRQQGGYRDGRGFGDQGLRGQGFEGRGFSGPDYHGGGSPRAGGRPFGYGGREYFRYRAAPYRYPGGYYGWARHDWRRGEWLPAVFITNDYYIGDWYDFGLWQPDYGCEWIRVGADAVLVNLADGQVIDVVPGVYYY